MEPIGDPLLGAVYEETEVGRVWDSRGRTVTEADVTFFAMFSGDWYPLHADVEYARESLFGERIAHGLLTLSVVSGFFPMRPGDLEAFYGMDHIRFRGPVLLGDTVRARFEILSKAPIREGLGKLTIGFAIRNQRDEVVIDGQWLFAQRMRDE